MKKKTIALIAFAAIVVASVYTLSASDEEKKPKTGLDRFAQCLTENGATMYGLESCPHCQEQKKMFGSSFKFIDYIECSEMGSTCSQKGITSVPVWIVDGKRLKGVQSLDDLAEETGCKLPED